jgi:hypothetical protein
MNSNENNANPASVASASAKSSAPKKGKKTETENSAPVFSSAPPVVISAPVDYDDEEAKLLAQLAENRKKKALASASAQITELRKKKTDSIEAEILRKTEEITRIQTEITELRKKAKDTTDGKHDTELTEQVAQTASVIRIVGGTEKAPKKEGDGETRERKTISRPALSSVIKSKTEFRAKIKGGVYKCSTENGTEFQADGKNYASLNKWLDGKTIELCGKNSTKISVYDDKRGVEVFVKARNEWVFMGLAHTETTTAIN